MSSADAGRVLVRLQTPFRLERGFPSLGGTASVFLLILESILVEIGPKYSHETVVWEASRRANDYMKTSAR